MRQYMKDIGKRKTKEKISVVKPNCKTNSKANVRTRTRIKIKIYLVRQRTND